MKVTLNGNKNLITQLKRMKWSQLNNLKKTIKYYKSFVYK